MINAIAAGCDTGTWQQKWDCGWRQPVSPAVAHAGSSLGSGAGAAVIAVIAVVLLIAVAKALGGRKAATSK